MAPPLDYGPGFPPRNSAALSMSETRSPATTLYSLELILAPCSCAGEDHSSTAFQCPARLRKGRRRTDAPYHRTRVWSPAGAFLRTTRGARTAPTRHRGCGRSTTACLRGDSMRSLLSVHTRGLPSPRRPSKEMRSKTLPQRDLPSLLRRDTSIRSKLPGNARRGSPRRPSRQVPSRSALSTPHARGCLRLASADSARRRRPRVRPAGSRPCFRLPRMLLHRPRERKARASSLRLPSSNHGLPSTSTRRSSSAEVPTPVNLTTLVFSSFSIQPSSKKRSQTAAPRAPPRCGRCSVQSGQAKAKRRRPLFCSTSAGSTPKERKVSAALLSSRTSPLT